MNINKHMTAEERLIVDAIDVIASRISGTELDIEVWAHSREDRAHCEGMLIGYRVALREMNKILEIIDGEK